MPTAILANTNPAATEVVRNHGADDECADHADACVLIVEDERLTALDLAARVERMGYSVVDRIAATADEAVALAQYRRPDVVLMDVRLKGEADGIMAAATIQQAPNPPSVVYVTAYSNPATVQRLKATSCAGWCVKPVDTHDLENLLARAVANRAPAFTSLERHVARLAVAGLSARQIAFATALAEDDVHELLSGILQRLRARIETRHAKH